MARSATITPIPKKPNPPGHISEAVLQRSRRRRATPAVVAPDLAAHFALVLPPPGVLPPKHRGIAQDESIPSVLGWGAQNAPFSAWAEGTEFLGYPYLALLTQRAEYRVVSDTIAYEMTREWIEFKSVSDDKDKTEEIKELTDAIESFGLKATVRRAVVGDSDFGRGHIFISCCDLDDHDELAKSIGDGLDKVSESKVGKGKLKYVKPVEAMWCYPNDYNSNDPLREDWYKPRQWFVNGKPVHHTRLLTLVGREVSDILKPVYLFGGLSMSQQLKPYVENWLKIRQSVANIVQAYSIWALKTNMNARLEMGGDQLAARIEVFSNFIKNGDVAALDNDTEDLANVSAPLGTLDAILAKAQELMAAIARIPLVKLLGIQPAGLNACLTGDTLIETGEGYVPIRDVHPGQMVMTREGWAPVAKSGCTGYATELIEITVGEAILRCTANHPIWLPSINAFVPAESVRPGHVLLCRGVTGTILNTVDRLPTVDVSGGIGVMGTMLPDRLIASACCSTGRSGLFTTGPSLRDTMSIIGTGIAGIIRLRTLNCLRLLSTRSITAFRKGSLFTRTLSSNVNAVIAAKYLFCGRPREPSFAAIGVAGRIDERTENHAPSRTRSPWRIVPPRTTAAYTPTLP